jgi:hypothetical protein
MTMDKETFEGGCLCGHIRFAAAAAPQFPHLCSCSMCRKWSGAPSLAWAEFPNAAFTWTGPGGAPQLFQSSKDSQRGNCPKCGSAICAVDDGYENISIVVGSLDAPDRIVPDIQHSFEESKPSWWQAKILPQKKTG